MLSRCDYLVSRTEIVGVSLGQVNKLCECLRPRGHEGPHLILNRNDQYILWIYDDTGCDCEGCTSEDPNDWCIDYGNISNSLAEELIFTSEYREE